jgi:hypothetical protein
MCLTHPAAHVPRRGRVGCAAAVQRVRVLKRLRQPTQTPTTSARVPEHRLRGHGRSNSPGAWRSWRPSPRLRGRGQTQRVHYRALGRTAPSRGERALAVWRGMFAPKRCRTESESGCAPAWSTCSVRVKMLGATMARSAPPRSSGAVQWRPWRPSTPSCGGGGGTHIGLSATTIPRCVVRHAPARVRRGAAFSCDAVGLRTHGSEVKADVRVSTMRRSHPVLTSPCHPRAPASPPAVVLGFPGFARPGAAERWVVKLNSTGAATQTNGVDAAA